MLPVLRPLLVALADKCAEREQLEELLIEAEQDSGKGPARSTPTWPSASGSSRRWRDTASR